MYSLYQTAVERWRKQALAGFSLLVCLSVIIAACQSIRFSSSLMVIASFGFVHWQEHITRMLNSLVVWAIGSGLLFALEILARMDMTAVAKALVGAGIGFGMGFMCPYAFALVLALAIYVPLGMLSFMFPDSVYFLSMSFAFLCSTYIVFLFIAVDTPPLLIEVIKKARPYFKLLALLVAALLVVQMLSALGSILLILMEHSVWRVHLPAFIIAFGGAMLVTLLINLLVIKGGAANAKALRIAGVFVLSIVTGNLSDRVLYWGEYGAAAVAAILGPMLYSILLRAFQKNLVTASSILAGFVGGLGAGLLIASLTGLRVTGQDWFGISCGCAIVLGFGASFGMILGPRISEMIARLLRLRPIVAMWLWTGFMAGIMAGMVAGAFTSR